MASSAQITMSLEEYNAEKLLRTTAENEAATLRADLEQLRIEGMRNATEHADQLIGLVKSALTVTKFAVANLPPETIRGWPVAALRDIAARMPSLPAFSTDDRDLCIEFEGFARECDDMEQRRQTSYRTQAAAAAAMPPMVPEAHEAEKR